MIAFMDSVWLLWFEQEREDSEDTELLIGVYRTEDDAHAAIQRLKDQPGFREYPKGFKAYEYVLGRDSWAEGFVLD
jgi:homoserine kinase type II